MSALFAAAAPAVAAELGAAMLRTTVILAVSGAIMTLWRGASAARRHTVWLAALVACGVAVVASPWLPATPLHVRSSPRVVAAARILGIEAPPIRSAPRSDVDEQAKAVHQPMMAAPSSPLTVMPTQQQWAGVVGLAWAIGFMSVLIRLTIGVWSVKRRARQLRPLNDAAWLAELRHVQTMLHVKREIALAWSEQSSTPVAFGVRRPTIALPAGAEGWDSEQRYVVLVHEMAHIARGDVATQLAAQFVCALLWFQPLIWFGLHRLRAEAESAADDCVLSAGVPASAYAARLLEFAQTSGPHLHVQTPAVGMFTDSNLERRFAVMLDTTRSRASTSRGMRRAAAVFALAGGTGMAGVRFAAPVTTRPVPNGTTAITTMLHPKSALPPAADPADEHVASVSSDVTAKPTVGDTSNPAVAATLPPASVTPSAVPDLSGTWIPDTTYVPPIGHRPDAGPNLTIAQNDSTIWIARREVDLFEMMGVPSADAWVGPYRTRHPQASALIHLDGTKGEEVASYAGHMVVTNTISGAWDGRTLVTTSTHRVPDHGGWNWTRIDRWSLTSDSTLVRAITIVTPPHGALRDTVLAINAMHLLKAREVP